MIKVNMMCGKRNFGNDWVHVDGAVHDHINSNDIELKTFANKSIDLIYCSHGIAYFNDNEIVKMLQSWRDVMKIGGMLRLSTPDWDVIRKIEKPLLGPIYGKMLMNNSFIYHKIIYNYESLCALLVQVGFKNIRRYNHAETEHPNTGFICDKYDDHSAAYYEDKLISLNVECNA